MYNNKNVLLIAGGGTLGTYAAKELLRLGCNVDIVCIEEKTSWDERLTFYQAYVTNDVLNQLFSKKHYDGVINFIHYPDAKEYESVHKLISDNTEHMIFLSSYRVYADEQHPITETAPRLLDTSTDAEFLMKEDYALSKARAEDFIVERSNTKNWTIVRPVISFSDKRFDIVTINEKIVLEYTKMGKPLILPQIAKNLTAGLDWAGNSGKLIANLLFKKEALCEAFTISSGQNITWGEVANLYTELIGTRFEWIDTDEWLSSPDYIKNSYWSSVYDRFFDRKIDNSKVLRVTGLNKNDFTSIKDGLKIELDKTDKSLYS